MRKILTVLLSLILGTAMLVFAACADNPPGGNGPGGGQTDSGNEGGTAEPRPPATSGDPASDTLVVYFSWSGNTQEMANYIAEQTGAYLVEIVPEEPYEGSYNDVAYGRAQEEAETNARPAVSQATYDLIDMENYDTVLVGYPIWWHTAPMVVGTFLEHYDWTGKDIYPFSQSASMSTSQFDESMQFVRGCAQNANVHDGLFVRPSDTDAIDGYLSEIEAFAKNNRVSKLWFAKYRNAVRLKPELVGTAHFMHETQSGGMRRPVWKGLREDK